MLVSILVLFYLCEILRNGNRFPFRLDDVSFIISLAVKLGPSSLQFIKGVWTIIFSNEELKKLLTSLKVQLLDVIYKNELPKYLTDLIVDYFA